MSLTGSRSARRATWSSRSSKPVSGDGLASGGGGDRSAAGLSQAGGGGEHPHLPGARRNRRVVRDQRRLLPRGLLAVPGRALGPADRMPAARLALRPANRASRRPAGGGTGARLSGQGGGKR